MDVVLAKETAFSVAKTFGTFRTERDFDLLWQKACKRLQEVRDVVKDTNYEVGDPVLPRKRKPSRVLADDLDIIIDRYAEGGSDCR